MHLHIRHHSVEQHESLQADRHGISERLTERLNSCLKRFSRVTLFLAVTLLSLSVHGQGIHPLVVQPTNPPGAPGPISGPIQLQSGSGSITATYTTTSASGATGYSWVATDDNVTMSQGTTSSILTIPAGYSGSFTINCFAWNSIGNTYSNYPLGVVVYGPTISGTVSPASQATNYNSAPLTALTATAATGSNGSFTYQWQSSPDNSNWATITGATSLSYLPPALTATTYYRIISNGFGSSATSSTATVTVYPQLTGGSISASASTINYNNPATLTSSAAAGGGNSSYAYLWQSSPDNTTWTDISTATATTYTSGNLTATTYFRRKVTSYNNSFAYSNTVTVTVYPQLTGGSISASASTLNYNNPATLTSSAAAGGGNSSYAYLWQSSLDNTTWTDITTATATTYTSGNLTVTTYFRRKVTSYNSSVAYSNTVTITVYPQLTGGSISASVLALNYNNPANLTSSAGAGGGNSSYAYQWQSSPDNAAWTDISTATATTYTSGNLTATTYFRRKVTSYNSSVAYSNTVTITVYPQLTGGAVSASASTLNYNNPATLTSSAAAGGGNSSYAYQWQSSPDNSTWTDITTATATSYTSGSLTATTYFRRKVTSYNSSIAYSNTVTITVYPQLTGGSISASASTLNYNNPANLTSSATAGGGNSSYAYLWQSSPDNTIWTDITTATATTYTSGNLTATTYFRRKVTSYNSSVAYSNTVTITVYPQLTGGSISASASTLNYNNPANLTSSATAGGGNSSYAYLWQSSPDNTTWTDITTATATSYTSGSLTATTYFRRKVTSFNSSVAYSNTVTITVYPQLTGGSISASASTLNYNNPANLTSSATAGGGNSSYAYLWQSSPDNATWTDITTATATTYTSGNLTATTYFRRKVTSFNSSVAYSNTVTITVYPQLTAIISPASQSIQPGNAAGIMTCTPGGGNGIFSYQWQSSTDNVTFANISGATAISYNPGTPALTTYYRVSVTSNSVPVTSTAVAVIVTDCVLLGSVPSAAQNYVMTSIPRAASYDPSITTYKSCDVTQTIQYLDGLGRPEQTVQVKGSPLNKDIVQPVAYDSYGREVKKYLSYASPTADGGYKPNAISQEIGNFYNPGGNGTSGSQQSNGSGIVVNPYPFSLTTFEPSPLNRVTEQGAPGAAWQPTDGISGHTVKWVYTTNDQIAFTGAVTNNVGSRMVRLYAVTGAALTPGATTYYDAGQLFVTISKDENWVSTNGCFGTTEEYKDKMGHVVLKRTYNVKTVNSVTTAEMLSTYYVYDDLGNLTFVLPPVSSPDNGLTSAVNQSVLDNLCYQYHYDERNRLTQKKVPGKGWEYMVYNKLDQLVLGQDAIQRASNQWTVTKYDGQGRVIMTGLWTDASAYSQATLQSKIYAAAQWDIPNTSDTNTGYSITSYPTPNSYLGINYYDDYSFSNIIDLPAVFNTLPAGALALPKGMPTGIKTNVLGTNNMLWDVNYYDAFGRVMQIYKQHYLNAGIPNVANYDVISNQYDFTNVVTSSLRKHYNTTGLAVTIANGYTYDHLGRKKQTTEQINTDPAVILSEMIYNEIGQVTTRKLHSEDKGGSFLQNTTYVYNERGWLSKINDPATTPTVQTMFAMQLVYNTGSSPQYNGNIASQQWYTYQQSPQTFNYTYDALNRLTSGVSVPISESGISYDLAGNIQTLKRDANAAYGYTYFSGTNQLRSVSGVTGNDYAYDPNSGNMTTDGHTGATITYNLLDQPQTVVKTGTGAFNIAYTYDASGHKLRKVSGTTTTEYILGIQYDNLGGTNAIDFIQTEEGRATRRPADGTYRYDYDLSDHLRNTRVSFYKDLSTLAATALQKDDYYPFGMRSTVLGGQNHYLYNKKELQDETGQYDYGARFYDPVIGRWGTIDPKAEIYQHWSPYNYVADNPITNTDPDGTSVATRYVDPFGKTIVNTNDGRDDIYMVPWSMYTAFANSVNALGGFNGNRSSYLDSWEWNNFWRNSLQLVADQTQLDIAGYGYLRSEEAREAQAKFLTTGNYADYREFLWQHEKDHWSDPVEVVGGFIAFGHGVASLPFPEDQVNTSGISKDIHEGKQGKHVIGHNNYVLGKSVLYVDAQTLLDELHSGKVKSVQIMDNVKTRVDFGRIIGNYFDSQTKVSTPTSKAIVVTSKTGAHIIPARP